MNTAATLPLPATSPGRLRSAGRLVLAELAALLLAAHHLRWGALGLVAFWALVPLVGLIPRAWAPRVVRGLLLVGAATWVWATWQLVSARLGAGAPWVRMALILGGVTAFTGLAAWRAGRPAPWHRSAGVAVTPSVVAFFLTGGALAAVQFAPSRIMLVDRLLPGAGWVAALALGAYAAWITEKMLDPRQQSRWRRRIWGVFSVLFFTQLLLGIVGLKPFLMSGVLHLPVPALIVAGPLYRGEGLFMLGLFATTVALVGPAWCSHLCYIGAWDSAMANRKRRPDPAPRWRQPVRVGITLAVFGGALALGRLGAPPALAALGAALFGALGVVIMVVVSRRTGSMTHCTTWCPMGLMATWLGRLNPFRMQIQTGCTDCMACSLGCRYDALRPEDVARRRPGSSCTLCGDCVGRCPKSVMTYRFPGLGGTAARNTFVTLVAALHALFVGVAMM